MIHVIPMDYYGYLLIPKNLLFEWIPKWYLWIPWIPMIPMKSQGYLWILRILMLANELQMIPMNS